MKLKILTLSVIAIAVLTGCSHKDVYTQPASFMKYDATNVKISELKTAKACRNLNDKNQVFEIGQAAKEAEISTIHYVDVEVTINTRVPSVKCYTIYGK